MTKQKLFFHFFLIALFTVISGAVYAAQPEAKGINFQDAATPIMHKIHEFHHLMLYIITPITLLVMGLLIYVMIRFRAKANPVPSKTTHHWGLEIAWTLIPTIIVLFIAVKSMQLLYFENKMPEADMTLKVTGYQWYWGYEYPDYGDVNFMAYMIKDNEIDKTKNQVRLLSTDNPVVVPVGKVVRVQVTASDVLHSFAMPSFGIKTDAVPGRLNETWFKVEKEGTYYGQCSEICGTGHAFMPIEIKAVPEAEFEAWIVQKGGTIPNATPAVIEGGTAPAEATDTAVVPVTEPAAAPVEAVKPEATTPPTTTPVAPATDKKDL